MWPIKEKENTCKHSCSYCGQFYPLQQTVQMRRYGSLIKINPSGEFEAKTKGDDDGDAFSVVTLFYSKPTSRSSLSENQNCSGAVRVPGLSYYGILDKIENTALT